MASGHVNRTQRPNTWLHRPMLHVKNNPCQLGAVHTWHKADIRWTHILMIRVQDTSHELRGVLLCYRIIPAPEPYERR